jgi:hypothetical protein
METRDIFRDYVWLVAEEWSDRKYDWPRIEAALEGPRSRDIEREKVLALLIGLRAGERQKDSPNREARRQEVLAELRFARGDRNRAGIRCRARALAQKRVDRIQSKLIFGFFLDRGRDTVSEADLNALLEAIEYIWHAGSGDRQTKLARVYGQFRSRVNRLKQEVGSGVEGEAAALFDEVYGIVIQYV